jgi:hypothetical protein
MKNLNQINEIMESLRYATLKIEPEDIGYISEMMQIAAKFDNEYAEAYSKLYQIFKHVLPGKTESVEPDTAIDKINKMTDEAMAKINKMGEEAQAKIHQELKAISTNTIAQAEKDMSDAIGTATEDITTQEEEDFREVEVPTSSEPEKSEPPIIFQHPDYPTIGAGSDGQVYGFKDGNWKKADTRSVYFPRKKDGTWGRVERQEILDLLNNCNIADASQAEPSVEKTVEEYDTLPEGYFIHPTLSNIAANEDGKILKVNSNNKWAPAETNEDGRGCRKIKGEKIGTGKCVYECINRRTVSSHVRHLNGDSWDDSFSNLTVYGDKNYHKFQQRTYGEADIHEICEYICAHNGDVSNISHDSKGKYSIYYARKILCKAIHDNISDKYFGYTSGGSLKIYREGEAK